MRAREFVRDYQGIDIAFRQDEDEITVRAMAGGREMGHATFVVDGDTLLPQDLEIDERYRGQGIAAVLYDYLKDRGYRIRRSGQQTAAGQAFWQRHRSGRNVWEQAGSKQATAQQVLAYINRTHHEPFEPDSKMATAVLAHPQWELVRVPLLNLNIPDQEYDDIDYNEYEPEMDPYGRQMTVEPGHAGEVSAHLVDRKPIVIDADRYIIDGNHRAWAAKYLLNRDYIQAWRPV